MIKYGDPPYLECSTRGDKRFSAFCAKIKNRNDQAIETIYQAAKIFPNNITGLSWRDAKGKKPINQNEISKLYSQLWDEYIQENPKLINVLLLHKGISDMFGQKEHCCQATELWRIRNSALNKRIIKFKNCKCQIQPGKFNVNDIPLDCPATWDLISSGFTTGVFQLESRLGKDWSQRVKPENIEELSALVAILRPGSLECLTGDTRIYRSRWKNKKGQIRYVYEKLENLYNHFHKFKNCRNKGKAQDGLTIYSINEENQKIFKNTIKNIVKTGVKQVYRLNLKLSLSNQIYKRKRFYSLKATDGHKFLTLDGWKELRELRYGDYIAIINKNFGEIDRKDARTNRFKLPNNNDVRWVMYIDKEDCGKQETYDIAVNGPFYNYIASDIVVHNSGQSESYVNNKFGFSKHKTLHPKVDEILKETHYALCIQEDSLVMMADGSMKPIKYVQTGEMIHSYNQNTKKIEPNQCHGCIKTRLCEGFILTLSDGSNIILTNDHKVLTDNGMKKVKNLNIKNDIVAVAINCPVNNKNKNSDIASYLGDSIDISYLIGYILGDGCFTKNNILCLGNNENNADKIINFINKSFKNIKCRKYWNIRSWYASLNCNKKTYSKKNNLSHFICPLGLRSKNIDKKIPAYIFKSNNKIISSCLAGLIESDGCIQKTNDGYSFVYFSSKSIDLLLGFRRLCQLLGIITAIDHKNHRVQIYNTKKFQNYINQYLKFKSFKGKLTNGETVGFYSKNIILRNRPNTQSIRQFCLNHNVAPNLFVYRNSENDHLCNSYTAQKFGINTEYVRYYKIKHIKKIDNQQFYSISIDKTHNLICNNVVVSNCYQEQAMKIAVEIAGFSLIDSDTLRIAIGKKKADLMSKMKIKFLEGANKKGVVSTDVAEKIFSWIEKSQRYQFNKSHSISYAMLGYQSAYVKCHFPKQFFTSYLNFSNYKSDPKEEIYSLVQDAKLFGIKILPPDIRYKNIDFKTIHDDIYFGLGHVRSVGKSAILKILQQSKDEMATWPEFLQAVPNLHKNVGLALIKSGAADCYGLNRSEMIRELETVLGTTTIDDEGKKQEIKGLTDKEKEYFFLRMKNGMTTRDILLEMSQQVDTKNLSQMNKQELVDVYIDLLKESPPDKCKKVDLMEKLTNSGYKNSNMRACANANRRKVMAEKALLLEQPINETARGRAEAEKHFLGIALSCSAADDVGTNDATHTCLETATAQNGERFSVCTIIDDVKHTVTKKGRNPGSAMCFLTISDSTYSIERAVVFPDIYKQFKHLCQKDYICLIGGTKKNGSFIIDNIEKLI